MSGPTYVPAQPGTRAVIHLRGSQAVLRAVLGWELRTGFEPSAKPLMLVRENSLPVAGELGIAQAAAVQVSDGRVESIDGSRVWAAIGDYCAAMGRQLVGE